MTIDASIVIPALNEGRNLIKTLDSLEKLQELNLEVIVVVDSSNDSTITTVENHSNLSMPLEVKIQSYGPGPANAIRYGIDSSSAECVVVMMADGSDDPRNIPELVSLVQRGVTIACASRYMHGGQQIGGPRFKKLLSKSAGRFLYSLAGVGTHDPTNSFKAYSKKFIEEVGIESRAGFEIGIELVAKAHRNCEPIAELPTIWLDRTQGNSNFKLRKWIPKYLIWFFYCFGPKRTALEKNRPES